MEFERLRIGAFGGLRDFDTGEEPLPRLVVVHGPNEAGKTTLFSFLTSVLYGFYPASRDGNPFTPWGGGNIDCGAVLRLADGERWEVHRRLMGSPSGSLTRGTTQSDLRNHTLPCAEHVPRTVFREVFALTLSELAHLEGESWARVQDRLVLGMGSSDLASLRQVVQDLERDAGRLWRPNRMGHQRIRDLRDQSRELRIRRGEAAEVDRHMREKAAERARLRGELVEARKERQACKQYVDRYRALVPLRIQLERLDGLLEDVGPEDDLAHLPSDPKEALDELADDAAKLARHIEEIEAETEEPTERVEAFGPEQKLLLDKAGRLREWIATVTSMEPTRVRVGQIEQELRDLERRGESASRELFHATWGEVDKEILNSVSIGDLRMALAMYREYVEERRIALEAVRTEAERKESALPFHKHLGPALLVAGVALVAGSSVFLGAPLTIFGAVLAGIGAALVGVMIFFQRRPADRSAEMAKERLTRASDAEEGAREEVAKKVIALPMRGPIVERPTDDLANHLERLQDVDSQTQDRTQLLAQLKGELDGAGAQLQEIAGDLEGLPPDPAQAAHILDGRIREAERAKESARGARRELERLARDRARSEDELGRIQSNVTLLEGRLRDIGKGDLERGIRLARVRLEARERADQLREELEFSHDDLDEIREKIRIAEDAGEDWAIDEDAIEKRKAREEEMVLLIEELGRRVESVERDLGDLGSKATVDAVDGEMAALGERLAEAVEERDRLWVLAAILREAERRFRFEHQPDILRAAGTHLKTITDERYDRLFLGDDGEGAFLLQGPGYAGPKQVGEPISRGTREQVYLAVRLAIVDFLDGGGERLPMFMDEAFVHWDGERRERTFDLLAAASANRQLFVFTCHDAIAASLHERGALRLNLETRL
ncbi:MAG TPA: AAA family ATPase [Longimicrobiales bacterium]